MVKQAPNATVLWIVGEHERQIEVNAVFRFGVDGDVSLEVELPFGSLGGLMVIGVGKGVRQEIARHLKDHP